MAKSKYDEYKLKAGILDAIAAFIGSEYHTVDTILINGRRYRLSGNVAGVATIELIVDEPAWDGLFF